MNNDEIKLVSYPKSGRTWLRLLLSKYFSLSLNDDTLSLEDIEGLSVSAGASKIILTHASANLTNGALHSEEALSKQFSDSRVLFVTRGFEDTLVSAFHQAKFRKDLFGGSLSEFVHDNGFGAKRLLDFYQSWASVRNVCKEFRVVRYEDMHTDPIKALKSALVYTGLNEPNSDLVEASVKFCRFDNLQTLERENFFAKKAMQARDTNKIETYKFREGSVGNFRNHLNIADLEFIYSLLSEIDNDLITCSRMDRTNGNVDG